MLLATELASVAQETFRLSQTKAIPYSRGGCALSGMDSGGFITYCLSEIGIKVKYKGTNDMYRKIGSACYSLTEARSSGLLIPGALLFCVLSDGMPVEYMGDGLGNADYAAICISPSTAVYPSQKIGTLIETKIDDKIVSGRLNTVVLCKYLVYETASDVTHSVIRKGNTGESVKYLQKKLNDLSYALSVDGDFGPATEAAVMDFQKCHDLTADGIVGAVTWAKLSLY